MIKPGWFDTFFILRPTLFFPAWTFLLAGYSRGEGSEIVLLLIWFGAALGASFVLNQLSDHREDRLNNKLWPVWGEAISKRLIYRVLAFLILLIILGGIWAGKELSGLLVLYLLIAGIFYNFRPFRLKSRPILGVLACGFGAWIGFLMGARSDGLSYAFATVLGMPYAIAAMAVTLLTHVPDVKGDVKVGAKTFPAVYGLLKTGGWALVLVVSCIIIAAILKEYVLLGASLVSLPFFFRYYSTQSDEWAQLAVKVSVFSLALAVGLTWIPFLFMISAYYPFARWYHRSRLGLDYPSFRLHSGHRTHYTIKDRSIEHISTI